jgi:tRNA (Thr-GGU) A37 N-methylase
MRVLYCADRVCVIEVEDDRLCSLDGLDRYSHAILVYRVPVDPDAPLSRTGPRPTGLNVAVVELLSHEDELWKVRGLSVDVGTEIADILPYDPTTDAVPLAVKPAS